VIELYFSHQEILVLCFAGSLTGKMLQALLTECRNRMAYPEMRLSIVNRFPNQGTSIFFMHSVVQNIKNMHDLTCLFSPLSSSFAVLDFYGALRSRTYDRSSISKVCDFHLKSEQLAPMHMFQGIVG
jgi:hypothetical protein